MWGGRHIWAGVLALWATAPLAAPTQELLACVQNQLTDLGYETGSTDGRTDTRTYLAALTYQQDRLADGQPPLPFLRAETALRWCRTLAQEQTRLRVYVPSRKPPEINAHTDVRIVLHLAYRDIARFLQQEYGVTIASRIDITAAWNVKPLSRRVEAKMKERGTWDRWMHGALWAHCGDPDYYGAAMLPGHLFFCWPRDDDTERRDRVLTRYMAHEYMHHVQAELSDDKGRDRATRGFRLWMGPKWMVEGSADLIENQFTATHLGYEPRSFDELFDLSRERQEPLEHFRAHGNVSAAADYDLSHFATRLLAERYGTRAIFNYWEALATGLSWEQAFAQSFGMGLKEFEMLFDTDLRRDVTLARAFATAQ